MKQSSFGNAAPKNRSIDVGANLLGEWISEQARLRSEIARYLAVLGASILVVGLVAPPLWRSGSAAAAKAEILKKGVAALDAQLAISDKARKEAQPSIIVGEMCARTRASFDFFRGQTDRVLRAGNSRTMLSSLRCEITAAEARVVVQAFAEDDGAADAFARSAREEGARVDAITNSRPSTLLAANGLSFEYVKQIAVSP